MKTSKKDPEKAYKDFAEFLNVKYDPDSKRTVLNAPGFVDFGVTETLDVAISDLYNITTRLKILYDKTQHPKLTPIIDEIKKIKTMTFNHAGIGLVFQSKEEADEKIDFVFNKVKEYEKLYDELSKD